MWLTPFSSCLYTFRFISIHSLYYSNFTDWLIVCAICRLWNEQIKRHNEYKQSIREHTNSTLVVLQQCLCICSSVNKYMDVYFDCHWMLRLTCVIVYFPCRLIKLFHIRIIFFICVFRKIVANNLLTSMQTANKNWCNRFIITSVFRR